MVPLHSTIHDKGNTLYIREEGSDNLFLRISKKDSESDSKTQSFLENNVTRQLMKKDEYESTQNRGYMKTFCFGLVISGVAAAICMCFCKLCNEVQKTVREVEEGNEINRTMTEQHVQTENRQDTQHVQGSVDKDKTHVHQDSPHRYLPASNPSSGPPPCYKVVNKQETLPPSYEDLFKGDS